jgi:hypothetical protein
LQREGEKKNLENHSQIKQQEQPNLENSTTSRGDVKAWKYSQIQQKQKSLEDPKPKSKTHIDCTDT